MGMGNVLVLAQVIAFLVSFISSFFHFIPVRVILHDFNGHCLLYATGNWQTNISGSAWLTDVSWGPDSSCNFQIFMGVIVMLLSLFFIVWESIYLFKNTDSSWLDAFVTAIICIIVSLFLFAACLTLSVGFKSWCELITQPASQINSCEQGQYVELSSDMYTNYYYSKMAMAQFGAWVTWLSSVALSVFSVIKVYKYHQQEAFLISMNRERQRLLKKDGTSHTESA